MNTPKASAAASAGRCPRRHRIPRRGAAALVVLLVVLAAGVIAPVQQRDAVATARFEARAVALVAMGATPADLCGGGGASGPGCLVCTCCCATAAALPVVPARQPRIGWLLSGAVCNLCEKGGPARRIFDPGTPLRGPPALA